MTDEPMLSDELPADSSLPPAPPPTRPFTVGQVLTLACANVSAYQQFCSYAELLDVVGFVLSDVPLHTEIPAAIEELCRPAVLAQHPELTDVGPPAVSASDAAVLTWLAAQEAVHGREIVLRALPLADEG